MNMVPNRANYERLPQLSRDLHSEPIEIEFKEKSVLRRYFSLQFRRTRRYLSRIYRPLNLLSLLLLALGIQLFFNGSYTESKAPKFEVDSYENVFIATNIVDGDLISNAWGSSLLSLVDLIGPKRVFVSIYGGPTFALSQLADMLECEHKVISEEQEPIPLNKLTRTQLPDGSWRIKRIAFLAEVRNKALEPLEELEKQGKKFGKILFINDVYFNPLEAIRLIWGTNLNKYRKAEYKAACAADFDSSWKYYDTFATRDAEGYSLGVPIFPWFSSKGEATSRNDILSGRDAVRVKSCWGGMVSFDARYFMSKSEITAPNTPTNLEKNGNLTLPLRFRSELEPFWDSSECCLVHADIMALPPFYSPQNSDKFDSGIYMNPYVRTAYSARAFAWIPFMKRFERLFAPVQKVLNFLVKMPRFNYRRTEISNEKISDRIWVNNNTTQNFTEMIHPYLKTQSLRSVVSSPTMSDEIWLQAGFFKQVERTAGRGGYCGVRQLMVLREKDFPRENNGKGGENWDNLHRIVPPFDP